MILLCSILFFTINETNVAGFLVAHDFHKHFIVYMYLSVYVNLLERGRGEGGGVGER